MTVCPIAHKRVVAMHVALSVLKDFPVGKEFLQDVVAEDKGQGAEGPIESKVQHAPAHGVVAVDSGSVKGDESVTVRPELLVAPVLQPAGHFDVVLENGIAIGMRLHHVEFRQCRAELSDVPEGGAVNRNGEMGELLWDPGSRFTKDVDGRKAGSAKTLQSPMNGWLRPWCGDQPSRPPEPVLAVRRWTP